MWRPRVIPCLLLQDEALVKTRKFAKPEYIGDPVNTVRIFNEMEVDEIVLLDISATPGGRGPDFRLLATLLDECFMPFTYGGGIRTVEEARRLFGMGVEKVALNSGAAARPELIGSLATAFGNQSVVASIDVRKGIFGGYEVVVEGGRRKTGIDPVAYAKQVEERGAGEILLTAVDRDGTREGYDLELISRVACAVGIPVVACGGAGSVFDLARATAEGGASAAAAGSLFVFQGKDLGVLVNFPSRRDLEDAFAGSMGAMAARKGFRT